VKKTSIIRLSRHSLNDRFYFIVKLLWEENFAVTKIDICEAFFIFAILLMIICESS